MPTTPANVQRHPVHPMLIPFPIALWVFSLVCDFVFLARGELIWWSIAYWSIVGGLIGGVLAAIPGFVDYNSIRNETTRRVATTHMALNLSAVVLFAVNLWLRDRGYPITPWPLTLSIVTILALAVSGWLGGTLVYIHRVAVSEDTPGASTQDRPPFRKAA